MSLFAFFDWLIENERKHQSVFIFEWVMIFFTLMMLATILFGFKLFSTNHYPTLTLMSVVAIASILSISVVLQRSIKITGCPRCQILPNLREETARKHIQHKERYVESGGAEGGAIMIFVKVFRIDKVSFHCKRCGHEWDEIQETSASPYRYLGPKNP